MFDNRMGKRRLPPVPTKAGRNSDDKLMDKLVTPAEYNLRFTATLRDLHKALRVTKRR